jgi:hypothetical protein
LDPGRAAGTLEAACRSRGTVRTDGGPATHGVTLRAGDGGPGRISATWAFDHSTVHVESVGTRLATGAGSQVVQALVGRQAEEATELRPTGRSAREAIAEAVAGESAAPEATGGPTVETAAAQSATIKPATARPAESASIKASATQAASVKPTTPLAAEAATIKPATTAKPTPVESTAESTSATEAASAKAVSATEAASATEATSAKTVSAPKSASAESSSAKAVSTPEPAAPESAPPGCGQRYTQHQAHAQRAQQESAFHYDISAVRRFGVIRPGGSYGRGA